MKLLRPLVSALALLGCLAQCPDALALNGFFAGKAGPIKSHTTQVGRILDTRTSREALIKDGRFPNPYP
jgi:hypothetical protein